MAGSIGTTIFYLFISVFSILQLKNNFFTNVIKIIKTFNKKDRVSDNKKEKINQNEEIKINIEKDNIKVSEAEALVSEPG